MAGQVLTHTAIGNAYQSFWSAFTMHATRSPSAANPLYPSGFSCTIHDAKERIAQAAGTFHLKNWPFRDESSSKRSKRIDIIASGWDRYDCSKGLLSGSNVKVMYLQGKANSPLKEPILQLHYDFQVEQGPRHPVFHAQFANVKFAPADLKVLNIQLKETKATSNACPSVRIPTPFVGLAGLLLGLVADHWDEPSFSKFLEFTQKSEVVSWPLKCDQLNKSMMLQQGNAVRSFHWYGCTA